MLNRACFLVKWRFLLIIFKINPEKSSDEDYISTKLSKFDLA